QSLPLRTPSARAEPDRRSVRPLQGLAISVRPRDEARRPHTWPVPSVSQRRLRVRTADTKPAPPAPPPAGSPPAPAPEQPAAPARETLCSATPRPAPAGRPAPRACCRAHGRRAVPFLQVPAAPALRAASG